MATPQAEKFWFDNWMFLYELSQSRPILFELLSFFLRLNLGRGEFVELVKIIDKRVVSSHW